MIILNILGTYCDAPHDSEEQYIQGWTGIRGGRNGFIDQFWSLGSCKALSVSSILRENCPAVTTARDEEFQDFRRQGGGRFSCRNCQTAEFAAKAGWKATSQAASCSFAFNGPDSGAIIVAGREERKESKGQAAAPEAPSHADFRVPVWYGLILQLFQRARKIDFPLCSQRLVSLIFAKCIHSVIYGHLTFGGMKGLCVQSQKFPGLSNHSVRITEGHKKKRLFNYLGRKRSILVH